MSDLITEAEQFLAGSHLSTASKILHELALSQCELSERDVDQLRWTGRLLTDLDWRPHFRDKSELARESETRTESIRPLFFSALCKLDENRLEDVGVTQEKDLLVFLTSLYKLLLSGGETPSLDSRKLEISSDFLASLAESVFARLTANGVPRDGELLTI